MSTSSMSAQHTPGPWRPMKCETPPARGRFDPARPWVLSRKTGARSSETMRDATGEVLYFATEAAAIAKVTGSAA